MKAARLRVGAFVALGLVVVLAGAMKQAGAVSTSLVISQVYGGGGNTGAPLRNDYIEVFNRSGSSVDVTGWSVQYASTTGSNWAKTDLTGVVPAGGYLLVQEAAGANTAAPPLPTPDATGTIAMAAGAGKVVLRNTNTLIAGGTVCPTDAETIDVVGYGTGTTCFEGSGPTATLSNTSAALRANTGCTDTDDNAADFGTGTPGPRNSATSVNVCGTPPTPTPPTLSVATAPLNPTPGTAVTITAAVTPGTNPASTGLSVACDLSWAGLGSSAPLFDDGTNGDATAGDLIFTLTFTIPSDTTPGTKVGSCGVNDAESRGNTAPYSVSVAPMVTDVAPAISTHTPGSDETNVAIDANIGITFSEAVDVTGAWYAISCTTTGAHTAAVTGGPTSFLLDPDADFAQGETCTVTVTGTQVSDQDTDDPPDNVEGNPSWSFTTVAPPPPALVVVSQVYGGGNNSGAQYTNDFIELFNRGTTAANLDGWSVQYTSATGTGTWLKTNLTNVTLPPGSYYLVQEAAGTTGSGVALPTPDVTGTTNMSATAGKVALINSTTTLSGQCPAGLIDLVGYGTTANCSEGSPTGNLSNTTAALRKGSGCIDTDNNLNDFDVGAPTPRNTASPFHVCGADEAPSVASRSPAAGASGVAADANVSVTFSEAVDVEAGWYTIDCATSGAHTATTSGGPTMFTLDPDTSFSAGESCTVTVAAAHVTDQDTEDPPDNMAADASWSFTVATPPVAIHDIQGAAHVSPLAGQNVSNVNGIVTAKRSNGFYMQDPNPDASDATSEGIFVFTSSAPSSVNVGDAVQVSGHVQEFRPGGPTSTNLTTTELSLPTIIVLSSGNPLPPSTVLGTGGRIPPDQVIEDDAGGDVETGGVFDPATDGIDFYESVEGMRVEVNDAVAVGPTNSFGETPIVGDNGANAGVRTIRGGVLLRPDDGNPERVVADNALVAMPNLNVGDGYSGPIVGVMDYSFGNFFLEVTNPVSRVDNGLQREVTDPAAANELSVATFNFENLDPTDPQSKFDQLAGMIVNNLRAPDLIGGEEVQDNTGPTNDGTVAANQTLAQLVAAIQAAGGPTYDWREIDPVNNQDGGEPGGNIRQAFLFRTDRGLSFVDRPGGTSTDLTAVTGTGSSTQLTFSPGRIDPTNAAWNTSRKPLAGEFMFHGTHVFAIVNHFNSKGGDQPLMGHFQPPMRSSETQRHQQAHLVADFVSQLTTADPGANVVVLGDLNDFEFSETVGILEAAGLHDLMNTLPLNQRYSYEFEGNAQVLDHIMFSGALFGRPFVFDPVHVNAEFWDQASDHDPSVVRVNLNAPPTAGAGGPYTVAEGGSVGLSASGADPEGGPLSYAWDLDNDGIFETAGQSPTFSAVALDGPSSHTVTVQVTDDGGLAATAATTVSVTNVAPTATFTAPASTFAGSPFTLSLGSPSDPSGADTAAGFTYAFDCGSGYGDFSSASSASCPTVDTGSRSVGGEIRDKDGDVTEYRGTVRVVVTFSSLCDLVKAYTTDAQTISQLCQRLDQAEKATNATAKDAHLATFRDLVDKSGVFTLEQAETLKRLSLQL